SLDSRYVHPSISLNCIGSSLVENIFLPDVVVNLFVGEGLEPNSRRLQPRKSFLPDVVRHSRGGVTREYLSGDLYQLSIHASLIVICAWASWFEDHMTNGIRVRRRAIGRGHPDRERAWIV